MLNGYKCFNSDLTNRYGFKYEVGKLYHADGKVKFGVDGNGFHMCMRLEDTFRYFDARNGDVAIGLVNCFGEFDSYSDDYNEWYDIYCYENMIIEKILSREDIATYGLNLSIKRLERFISLYKLTPEEILLFKEKFKNDINILNYIAYYQEGNKEIFNRYVKTKKW